MIEFSRTTWCHQLANVEFQLSDVQSFELPGAFDLAFSNSVLHWVPDHLSVLWCVSRVLKPAGRVVFSMGGRGTAATAFRALEKFSREGQWAEFLTGVQSPHHFFGPEDYLQWLPKAGLQATRVALVPKSMRHENNGALEGWLRTTWMPYTERIPADRREQFLHEFAGQVRNGCETTDDGAILMPMVNLEVEATKTGM